MKQTLAAIFSIAAGKAQLELITSLTTASHPGESGPGPCCSAD